MKKIKPVTSLKDLNQIELINVLEVTIQVTKNKIIELELAIKTAPFQTIFALLILMVYNGVCANYAEEINQIDESINCILFVIKIVLFILMLNAAYIWKNTPSKKTVIESLNKRIVFLNGYLTTLKKEKIGFSTRSLDSIKAGLSLHFNRNKYFLLKLEE